jgi:lipopolysaccharide transport system ATP-binding protein
VLSDLALSVEGLGKEYRIGARPGGATLRQTLNDAAASLHRIGRKDAAGQPSRRSSVWSLQDVSFSVSKGEVLGVIGRNGSGKSTLLKIMSRITEPTTGSVDVYGRVGALLEVGTGFHPELTGRDNIFLNGSILGMDRSEVRRRFDEIVDFSGVAPFLETPVKRYSSGMYLRLAFSVAAHLETEILLLDEVLAVGDADFQKKCAAKLLEAVKGGRTILLVSHDLLAVQNLCSRAIMLDSGRLVFDGGAAEAVEKYLASPFTMTTPGKWLSLESAPRAGSGQARFSDVRYHGASSLTSPPESLGPVRFSVRLQSKQELNDVRLAVVLFGLDGTKLVNADTVHLGRSLTLNPGESSWDLTIERLYLRSGTYNLGLWLADEFGNPIDWIELAAKVIVRDERTGQVGSASEIRTNGVVPCRFEIETAGSI